MNENRGLEDPSNSTLNQIDPDEDRISLSVAYLKAINGLAKAELEERGTSTSGARQ
jgi:hypothetical protein